jgi:hypothetical protein
MCQTVRKGFLSILTDNEDAYFRHLNGIIDSVDELAIMEITKNPESYHFRLAASLPKYNNMLLEEILKLHNLFKIRLDLSKSIKSSATIVFEISLDN